MATSAVELRPHASSGYTGTAQQFDLPRSRELDMNEVAAAFGASNADDIWLEDERGNPVMGSLRAGKKYIVCGLRCADEALEALKSKADRPRVGLAYSDACLKHMPPPERARGHPEAPQRVQRAWEQLQSSGIAELCQPVEAEPATETQLRLLHTAAAVNALFLGNYTEAPKSADGGAQELPEEDPPADGAPVALPSDTYVGEGSKDAVLSAVGLTLASAEAVAAGRLDAAFCLVRPPGHHCTACRPSGGCLVNNVALAAAHLRKERPDMRLAIVDFDVHHGNGTQKFFEDDPMVLFASMHRYDEGKFYPHTGAPEETGSGAGAGLCFNVAFNTLSAKPDIVGDDNGSREKKPEAGFLIGDWQWEVTADELLAPVLAAWQPEVLLVSAGFDAACGDPLGRMNVMNGFSRITSKLQTVVPRMFMVLEGGYHVPAVAAGVESCVRVLLGLAPPPAPAIPSTAEQRWTASTLLRTANAHVQQGCSHAAVAAAVAHVAGRLQNTVTTLSEDAAGTALDAEKENHAPREK
eukprot:TRINITY_DN50757_c0_g1_i1.p1 TRINITY_DN50757_c0_g1~~TRINITY_DN50757_c0_g1_i1.p1  ORF type:complete len:525 (-),score=82.49 TRINITY_DN50757_c0_g1_i1:165-1739(-)